MTGALSGIKVLDLSRFIAGPHCGMLLGDLGADVIKVERPQRGDETRSFAPKIAGDSTYFMAFNRNKRSMTLNFRDPKAQAILRDLAANADILIENFRPGTMEKMGCGWEVLHELNPRLIMARISGYGRTGKLANEPCFDSIAQAISGLMSITGDPNGPPTLSGTFVADYTTALYATAGVLAALHQRDATGTGHVVDVSLVGSAVALSMTAITDQLLFDKTMSRLGNRDRYSSPAQAFKAKDGHWLYVNAGNDTLFPRLARIMGRPDMLDDPRFATLNGRMQNIEATEQAVADWVAEHTADEIIAKLSEAEVPGAKVATVDEVATSEYMHEAGHIVPMAHPQGGTVPIQNTPIRLDDAQAGIRMPPPQLGQHTAEVLTEWLGCSADEIAEMKAAGVT